MFPEVAHKTQLEARLKSVKNENYVYMRANDNGEVTFGTKALTSSEDPEVDFTIHLYSVPELGETELALPVHSAVGSYFKKTLAVESDNDIPELPTDLKRANPRFFYFKQATEQGPKAVVLEAMNGVDYKYFLSVSGADLTLMEYNGDSNLYPPEVIFYLDDSTFNLISN